MTLFELLRDRAKQQPMMIASRSSRRVVTYRKFWSRIERGTARLKSEWNVEAGDTVAYWGLGHQDALMLYIATARCGARLLPLEHPPMQAASADILRQIPVKLLLHDDELVFAQPPAVPTLVNLSSLIATRCHHTPEIEEDAHSVSLLTLSGAEDGGFQVQEQSLQQLSSVGTAAAAPEFRISAALFDTDVFAPQVLATLTAGGTIIFR
ncbi:long-chain-fatty-acid--CoA ligase [compost metagenome]